MMRWPGLSRPYVFVIAIWVCFLIHGSFYASILPLWEGYDEWAHYSFIEYVVTRGGLPDGARNRVSSEVERSLSLAPGPWDPSDTSKVGDTHESYWSLPISERANREKQLQELPLALAYQPAGGNVLLYEALQPPLYYWLCAPVLRATWRWPLVSRVFALRWWSVLLASAMVPFCFLCAVRILGREDLALAGTALIATMPEFMIDVARVGNDCLAVALFSLLVYLTLRMTQEITLIRLAAAAGAVLGLGLLTKVYFLTAIPALAFVLGWQYWNQNETRRATLLSAAVIAAMALPICGWWFLRNLLLTHTFTGLSGSLTLAQRGITLPGRLLQIPQVNWASAIDAILFSHIWFGGWSGLMVRSWMYHLLYAIILLAAVGLIFGFVVGPVLVALRSFRLPSFCLRLLRHREGVASPPFFLAGTGVLSLFYGFFWIGQLYNVLLLSLSVGASTSMGWYMYCVVVPEALLAVVGLLFWFPARWHGGVLTTGIALFAMLDLYSVHFLLLPYYAGLLPHRADGFLSAFHPAELRRIGFAEFFSRLQTNKPIILHGWGLPVIWALYVAGMFALIAIPAIGRRKAKAAVASRCLGDGDQLFGAQKQFRNRRSTP